MHDDVVGVHSRLGTADPLHDARVSVVVEGAIHTSAAAPDARKLPPVQDHPRAGFLAKVRRVEPRHNEGRAPTRPTSLAALVTAANTGSVVVDHAAVAEPRPGSHRARARRRQRETRDDEP